METAAEKVTEKAEIRRNNLLDEDSVKRIFQILHNHNIFQNF